MHLRMSIMNALDIKSPIFLLGVLPIHPMNCICFQGPIG
jgi:hypothetical protein